jgi:hypothetical protein
MRPRTSLGALVILLAGAASVRAQEHARVWLDVDPSLARSGCPAAPELARAVEARLGRPLGAEDAEDAGLVVAVERVDAGFSVDIVVSRRGGDALGTRHIESTDASCRTLAESLPLVLAMIVDLREQDARLALPTAPPAPAAVTESDAADATTAAAEPLAPGALVGSLDEGAGLDVGWLPSPAVSLDFAVRLGVRAEPVSLSLRGALLAPNRSGDPRTVDIVGARFSAGACARATLEGIGLGGCAALEAGWLRIIGNGFDVSLATDAPHLAALALVELALPIAGPLDARIELGASVPFLTQRIVALSGVEERVLHVSSPVTLRAGVALGLRVQ